MCCYLGHIITVECNVERDDIFYVLRDRRGLIFKGRYSHMVMRLADMGISRDESRTILTTAQMAVVEERK